MQSWILLWLCTALAENDDGARNLRRGSNVGSCEAAFSHHPREGPLRLLAPVAVCRHEFQRIGKTLYCPGKACRRKRQTKIGPFRIESWRPIWKVGCSKVEREGKNMRFSWECLEVLCLPFEKPRPPARTRLRSRAFLAACAMARRSWATPSRPWRTRSPNQSSTAPPSSTPWERWRK